MTGIFQPGPAGENPQRAEWYCVHTRPQKEGRTAARLHEGLGLETYFPRLKRRRTIRRVKRIVTGPLFPRYLFCRFDVQNRLPILKTPGVLHIVGYNRQPISVDEAEIAAIQTLVASGVPNQPCSFVEIGDRVRIAAGPLRGLEGILVESRGQHKFVLSVTLLQRSVAVELDSLSVVPCRSEVADVRETSREFSVQQVAV